MADLRTAAQQALEVLEQLHGGCTDSNDGTVEAITVWCPEVIDALRAALAQAEPVQPVAWVDERAISWLAGRRNKASAHVTTTLSAAKSLERPMALYTAPQPQQTEPSQDTPPQHEYEVTANDDGTFSVALPDGEELRIIPPQRKPLTEEEIINIGKEARAIEGPHFLPVTFARAIERAHGIKEKA